MDATTISLIGSAFGGALITGLVALITHALAGRREHHKWLREEKLKAYADFLTVGRNTEWEIRAHKQGYATREDALKAVRSINHFQSKLLAPERIYSLMDRYHQMLSSCIHVESRDPVVPSDFEPTMNKASETRKYMSLVMAGDLGVRPDSRMKVWRQEIIDWWYNIRQAHVGQVGRCQQQLGSQRIRSPRIRLFELRDFAPEKNVVEDVEDQQDLSRIPWKFRGNIDLRGTSNQSPSQPFCPMLGAAWSGPGPINGADFSVQKT